VRRSCANLRGWQPPAAGGVGEAAALTYLHVMSDLGEERFSAEDAIRAAREALVPSSYPRTALNEGEADAG
jgi:hypothetical protein